MLKKFFAKPDWSLKLSFLATLVMCAGVFLPWGEEPAYLSADSHYYTEMRTVWGFQIGPGQFILLFGVMVLVGCLVEKFAGKIRLVRISAQVFQTMIGLGLFSILCLSTLDSGKFILSLDPIWFWFMLPAYFVWFIAVLLRFLMNFRLANFDRSPAENSNYFRKNS